jgi:hypothetical protein
MFEVLDAQLLAAVAEIDDVAGRTPRGDRRDFVGRELAFGEDVEHLAPDSARRSNDDDPIAHIRSFAVFAARYGNPASLV